MSSSEFLLELNGVHTHIAQYHILEGVDLNLLPGELVMLLGRNGAGKSTTLRTIMGLWRASAGCIKFSGEDISRLSTPQIARRSIAYVPEEMAIFSQLTVAENMLLAAREQGLSEERKTWIFELFPALERFWESAAGNLSGGQKQMVAIARAIAEPRKLLIIDEPSKGLSPAMINQLMHALTSLKQAGTTILLVEQNFHVARTLGDRVFVMDEGRVVHQGAMADLAADENLQQQLLGLSVDAVQATGTEG